MGGKLGMARARRALTLATLDGITAAGSVVAAFWLRFEGVIPAVYLELVPWVAALAAAVRFASNAAAPLRRWSFRLAGPHEGLHVTAVVLGGSVLLVALSEWLLPRPVPRSVYVLEFFLTTALTGAARFGPRAALRFVERLRRRGTTSRAFIIGDGAAAELLARQLERRPDPAHQLVGFVTGNPAEVGSRLAGKPVLGEVADLPALIARHAVTTVLLAERCQDPARVRQIIEACASCAVRFKIVPPVFEQADRLTAAMLEDVSPADLLARPSVAFDEAATQALVRGRRVLVTGAGGSIGSELCRQLARLGVRRLVMVDMNENELYLGARRLAERYPELDLRTEVADVREAHRLRQLGAKYLPQDVFHAAAHKHVPLMEDAPEEAVKNNVFGTLHVARMAQQCGAERFVLISTDKAVKPTSVMGATKRVAELVVRHLGRTSRTRMTAVRFGNVFGSAGSVVPLFREQIARGGPVTVTHPECMRYFMTISEAVGLTMLAGLGGHGDLCVLDMGAPVKIAELARYMIMLAGKTGEIPVVYTGLRPGEKLLEELLTEEEEQSEVVRDGVHVTRSPPPPADLLERLATLRLAADAGDRLALLGVLRELVPSYRPPRNTALPEPERGTVGGAPLRRERGPEPAAALVGSTFGEPATPAAPIVSAIHAKEGG